MKILTVGNPFPTTKQNFVHNKIEGLALRNHQIINLSFSEGDNKALKKWRNSYPSSKIFCYSFNNNLLFLFKIFHQLFFHFSRTFKLIKTIFRESRPLKIQYVKLRNNLLLLSFSDNVDIIHFEWNNVATFFCESFPLLKKPFIVSIRGRGITSQPLIDDELKKKLPVLFKYSTLIHSISHDLVSYLGKYSFDVDKVRVINPAMKLDNIPVKSSYYDFKVRLVTTANFVWKKNLLQLIITFYHLKKKFENLEYWIIGNHGPMAEGLLFLIHELKIQDSVKLLGNLPHSEVLERLVNCDIFLMYSLQEGFCNSVIEAQAVGLPVVVSDADGLAENIEDGLTGFVVSRWDFDELYRVLEKLICDPALRERLGKNGVIRARKRYNISDQILKFENLYFEALGLKKPC